MTTLVLLASLAAGGYTLWYLAVCMTFGYGNCRRCKGAGKLGNPLSRRTFRLCPRCDGTGIRLRLGRRVIEYLRAEHRRGTR